jgi:hypothetical protein
MPTSSRPTSSPSRRWHIRHRLQAEVRGTQVRPGRKRGGEQGKGGMHTLGSGGALKTAEGQGNCHHLARWPASGCTGQPAGQAVLCRCAPHDDPDCSCCRLLRTAPVSDGPAHQTSLQAPLAVWDVGQTLRRTGREEGGRGGRQKGNAGGQQATTVPAHHSNASA